MDQSRYLSQTLWEYRGSCEFTDITLLCEDGSLPAHVAILAPFFSTYGINFLPGEESPECLFLPNFTTTEVFKALRNLYHQNKAKVLHYTMDEPYKAIKSEANEESDEEKENITGIVKISYFDKADDAKGEKLSSIPEKSKLEAILSEQRQLENNACNLCEQTFSSSYEVRKHKYRIHKQDKELIWKEWKQMKENMRQNQIKQIESTPNMYSTGETNVCKYCQQEIKNRNDYMKMHYALRHREEMIKHHPDILLTKPCLECELMFFFSKDLSKHLHEVHGKLWDCSICNQYFDTKKKRLDHRMIEHADELEAQGISTGRKDQECPYCHKMYEKQFQSRLRMTIEKHIFNFHKKQLYLHPEIKAEATCKKCDTEFYSRSDLKQHGRMAHSGPAVCPVCSKEMKQIISLREHMNIHRNESHICDVCSSTYKSLSLLKKHHHKVHLLKLEAKFSCQLCFYTSQNEETLQNHNLNVHSGVQYFCLQCPKSFNNDDARKQHETRSHGDRKDKCEECDASFSGKSLLKAHYKNVHIKEKNKICPHCGEAFFLYESFKIHVLRHTDDRQFPCEVCGKAFLTKRDIEQHMNCHTLPQKCDQCEKRFASKHSLQDHVKMRHNGIKNECRFICGYEAWYKIQCTKHEKVCSLNPVPGAPYSVAVGTASSLTLQRYHDKLKQTT